MPSPFPHIITLFIFIAINFTALSFIWMEYVPLIKEFVLSFWIGLGVTEIIYFWLLYEEKQKGYSKKKSGILPVILLQSLPNKQKKAQLNAITNFFYPSVFTCGIILVIFFLTPHIDSVPIPFAFVPAIIFINSGIFLSYNQTQAVLFFTSLLLCSFLYLYMSNLLLYQSVALYILFWGGAGFLKGKILTKEHL